MYYALTVPALPESLPVISAVTWAIVSDAHLSYRKAYRFRLAVDEIATNIIQHGAQRAAPVHLFAEITPRQISIILEDTGIPYDITQEAPIVNVNAPLGDREVGGLGVFLVVRYIDDIRYDYVNGHNVNRLTMMRD
jgi:serine/threonine-protein kinase RsbW